MILDFAIDSRIYLNDPLDLALQELDILFNTQNTELIGFSDFGTFFEQFLWQFNPSPNDLEKYITDKINSETLFLKNYNVIINVDTDINIGKEQYIVNIKIEDNSGNSREREYHIK